MAVGKLFGYEGNVIVIADAGPGFCSASPAAFDSFRAGNTVDGTSLQPICVRVNDFQAHYLQSGQATSFAADIDYQAGRDLSANSWRPYRLEVNPANPDQYRLDGEWKNFEKGDAAIRVKIFGPLIWTVHRPLLWSVQGPVLKTDHGVFAVRYAGMINGSITWRKV